MRPSKLTVGLMTLALATCGCGGGSQRDAMKSGAGAVLEGAVDAATGASPAVAERPKPKDPLLEIVAEVAPEFARPPEVLPGEENGWYALQPAIEKLVGWDGPNDAINQTFVLEDWSPPLDLEQAKPALGFG